MKMFKYIYTVIILSSTLTVNAHWTTRGPYGGNVTALHVSDTVIYAGTETGGVYRTTSSSATAWRYANYNGLASPYTNAITSIGSRVIAATSFSGIFISDDMGNSWNASNAGITDLTVWSLHTSGNSLIAGTQDSGVFVSNDSGMTWMAMSDGLSELSITCISSFNNTWYAGTHGGGVFISIDNGISWSDINTGLTDTVILSLAADGNTLYAGTGSGLYIYDSGSWSSAPGLPPGGVNAIAINSTHIFAGTEDGVYSSPKSTVQFSPDNMGFEGKVNALALYNNDIVAGVFYDGAVKSPAANPGSLNWTAMINGLNNRNGHTIYNDGLLVISATNDGLFVSKDLATNYVRSNNGLSDSTRVTSLAFSGSNLFAATQYGGVFLSPDTGLTWTSANTSLPASGIAVLAATPSTLFAAGYSSDVYYSSSNPVSWSQASGIPFSTTVTSLITDGSLVFAGTLFDGVYKSTDNGVTFSPFNNALNNPSVTCLAIHNGFIYAGTLTGGVFKSDVNSDSWQSCNTGIPSMEIQCLFASGQWVVAGIRGGVYSTYDGGNTWLHAGATEYIPPFADINAISFSASSPRIFAATSSNSFYSNSISELATGVDEINAQIELDLFPNPTNGILNLHFGHTGTKATRIIIYSADGQKVFDRNEPGNRILLPVLPDGLYIARIETDAGTAVRSFQNMK